MTEMVELGIILTGLIVFTILFTIYFKYIDKMVATTYECDAKIVKKETDYVLAKDHFNKNWKVNTKHFKVGDEVTLTINTNNTKTDTWTYYVEKIRKNHYK